jgi:hypothetical protein
MGPREMNFPLLPLLKIPGQPFSNAKRRKCPWNLTLIDIHLTESCRQDDDDEYLYGSAPVSRLGEALDMSVSIFLYQMRLFCPMPIT